MRIRLRDNPAKLVVWLAHHARTFPSAFEVPFDPVRGTFCPARWHTDTLAELLKRDEPEIQIYRRLLDDGRLHAPERLLYIVDLEVPAYCRGQGFGRDALEQLHALADGIDVSCLRRYDRFRAMPNEGWMRPFEYVMGNIQGEAAGFWEKMGYERLLGMYVGKAMR